MEDTAGAGAPEAGGAACSRDGTTCLRQAALGANTPWKRTKWWRGGGISESSLRRNSVGARSSSVCPSAIGRSRRQYSPR